MTTVILVKPDNLAPSLRIFSFKASEIRSDPTKKIKPRKVVAAIETTNSTSKSKMPKMYGLSQTKNKYAWAKIGLISKLRTGINNSDSVIRAYKILADYFN